MFCLCSPSSISISKTIVKDTNFWHLLVLRLRIPGDETEKIILRVCRGFYLLRTEEGGGVMGGWGWRAAVKRRKFKQCTGWHISGLIEELSIFMESQVSGCRKPTSHLITNNKIQLLFSKYIMPVLKKRRYAFMCILLIVFFAKHFKNRLNMHFVWISVWLFEWLLFHKFYLVHWPN